MLVTSKLLSKESISRVGSCFHQQCLKTSKMVPRKVDFKEAFNKGLKVVLACLKVVPLPHREGGKS
jgi:hypothetical protein